MEMRDVLRFAIDTLERLQIPYLLCGSAASGGYDEPRMTRDIDFVIELPLDKAAIFCDTFPAPEFVVSKEAAIDAVRNEKQFSVRHLASGNKIDFMIARDCVWSRLQFERRQQVTLLENVEGFVLSPEDLILSKMYSYHEGGLEKHLRDITGILSIQEEKIDRDYISQWATQLEVTEVWSAILGRMGRIEE